MFGIGDVRVNGCESGRQVGSLNGNVFSIFYNMKVFCAFSVESPHRGDSDEHTQYTIFNKKKMHYIILDL